MRSFPRTAFGALLSIMRAMTFGMPMMYPTAICMAFEMATYGLIIGLLFARLRPQSLKAIYISLMSVMIAGRLVWGLSRVILLTSFNTPFSFQIFITAGFITSIPAIILQLILISLLMEALRHSGIFQY